MLERHIVAAVVPESGRAVITVDERRESAILYDERLLRASRPGHGEGRQDV